MSTKPLKAAAKSGVTHLKTGVAGQPNPLPALSAAGDGAAQPKAGRKAQPNDLESGAAGAQRATPPKTGKAVRLRGLEFPGCKPVYMTREDIANFEGRLEFWDADASTAWVCEPNSPYHERPSRKLVGLAERIALARGSSISSYGHMDLLLRDRLGHARRIMQADESLYLHPAKARLPGISAMVVGEDDFPDVVLEVDHSTDVRRGKLKLYESWGFPEIWVEVPEQRAPSRPRSRLPGLTIHVLEDGAYQVSPQSRAFPGWMAEEIHAALNEAELSTETVVVLERVGAALGTREGTGPSDDLQMRRHLRQGVEKGRIEGLAAAVRQILKARGIPVSEHFPTDAPWFAEVTEEVAINAALTCGSEEDFGVRLRDASS